MWPFRRKPKSVPIPPYRAPDAQIEPPPAPMEVTEVLDPSQSLVMRFQELIKKRLKTGD